MLRQALVVSLVVSAAGLYGQTAKPESPKETTSPVRPADVKKSATPKTPEEIEKAIVLWRDRAERLTNASLEDEWSIGSMREVLHARLAEAW